MGTVVISGSGFGQVLSIGRHTAFGKISADLSTQRPETEFQKGLNKFSLLLVRTITILCIFLFIINFLLGHPFVNSLLFALSIAIGLTPELFPVIVTVTLAHGGRKLAQKKVVVKQLSAIENLGNMKYLCTDKTGTITQGKIILENYYDTKGKQENSVLELALACNSLNRNDKIRENNVDSAIWGFAHTKNHDIVTNFTKIASSPFDFNHRAMFTVVKIKNSLLYIIKGSPETVISHCRLLKSNRLKILKQYNRLSASGVRVIALALKSIDHKEKYSFKDATNLHFSGLLTFSDIPKPHIREALDKLESLGVTIKVITGDNEIITRHICEKAGIPSESFLLGEDIFKMSEQKLIEVVKNTDFFARVDPDQKVRIINALKADGSTVGYMGDGINDAPALHAADVAISVNTAVDVAKDSATVVLLDKSLDVIADGIIEGRKIFANTMKYVLAGTSSNFGNMFSAAAASFILPYFPMTASQILLTNLLYDISQVTIPTDNVDPESLKTPKQWDINLVKKYMYIFGPLSSLFDFATFGILLLFFKANEATFQTGWFIESLITEILVIFIIRTKRVPFFTSKPGFIVTFSSLVIVAAGISLTFSGLGKNFGFVPLPAIYFLMMFGLSIGYLSIVESVKYFSKIF
jgi:Mg2+-importing ATPase